MKTVMIDGKEYQADDLRKLADEMEREPKRFVPEEGEDYWFVSASFNTVYVTNDGLPLDRERIAEGSCYPTSELVERAASMMAEASRQIHAALMVDPDVNLQALGFVFSEDDSVMQNQGAKILEGWK